MGGREGRMGGGGLLSATLFFIHLLKCTFFVFIYTSACQTIDMSLGHRHAINLVLPKSFPLHSGFFLSLSLSRLV